MSKLLFLHDDLSDKRPLTEYFRNLSNALEEVKFSVTHLCWDISDAPRDMDIRIVSDDQYCLASAVSMIEPNFVISATPHSWHSIVQAVRDIPLWTMGDATIRRPRSDRQGSVDARSTAPSYKGISDIYPTAGGILMSSVFDLLPLQGMNCHLLPLAAIAREQKQPKDDFDGLTFSGACRRLRIGTSLCNCPIEDIKHVLDNFSLLRQVSPDVECSALIDPAAAVLGPIFNDQRVIPHISRCTADRHAYLRTLDVFLPSVPGLDGDLEILEAYATGTVAISGADESRPEICPLVLSNFAEVVGLLRAYLNTPRLLIEHTRICERFLQGLPTFEDIASQLIRVFFYGFNQHLLRAPQSAAPENLCHARAPAHVKNYPFYGILDLPPDFFAEQIYLLILRRQLDDLGRFHINSELEKGATTSDIVDHMLMSNEFFTFRRHDENAQWLRFYLSLCGHEAPSSVTQKFELRGEKRATERAIAGGMLVADESKEEALSPKQAVMQGKSIVAAAMPPPKSSSRVRARRLRKADTDGHAAFQDTVALASGLSRKIPPDQSAPRSGSERKRRRT